MDPQHNVKRHNLKLMNRFDLTRRLVAQLTHEEAVIGGIGHANFDLWAVGHRPQNFYMLGSMGLAVPIALGVAIAQPGRKVFALEGDGSMLMQLGALSTVAARAPKNLAILCLDNGTYQITGGQPTPAAETTDFVAVARACGLAQAAWAADEADFERLVAQCLTTDGPHFIGLKLDDAKPRAQTERDPSQIRDRFMRGMGAKPSRVLG
jgi:thiamine pyrophosphate-dependent acetolactate synthase large subunit-like protein